MIEKKCSSSVLDLLKLLSNGFTFLFEVSRLSYVHVIAMIFLISIFILQADSYVWQNELESVHFTCSNGSSLDFGSPTDHSTQVDESRNPELSMDIGSPTDHSVQVSEPRKPESSLDFGSPTDHSTQVDEPRKPVTRCRSRSLKGIRSINAEDSEHSSIKYLGIISQPLSAQSDDSDVVMEESKNKIETIDLLTSSDSYREHSYARNDSSINLGRKGETSKAGGSKPERNEANKNSIDSSDNSEIRYLGIVTQTSKPIQRISKIKLEAEKNIDNSDHIVSSSNGLDQSPGCQVKIESESSSQSLLQKQEINPVSRLTPKKSVVVDITENGKKKENHASQVPGAKTLRKHSSETSDNVRRISLDKQSDLSLTLSSDKSVISPSPEAEIAHISPFSVVGNVSRLTSTRIRRPANQTRTTEDDGKSILAPVISNLTETATHENHEDGSHATDQVRNRSVLGKMFHLKSPRKNLEKLIEEIKSQSENFDENNTTCAADKISTESDSSDYTEASVEVVVKDESAQIVTEGESLADRHEASSNISATPSSVQGDTKPDFTKVLNKTDRAKAVECNNLRENIAKSSKTVNVADINVHTSSENNDSFIEMKNFETNETRPLNHTDAVSENLTGRYNKRNGHKTTKSTEANSKNPRKPKGTRQLNSDLESDRGNASSSRESQKQTNTSVGHDALSKTESVNTRETELKRCSVRLVRMENDTNSVTNSVSVKTYNFKRTKGILRDLMAHENVGRKNKQKGSKAREVNTKIDVLTQASTSEENMDVDTETGSEDSSIEENEHEENMENSPSDIEIASTQTTSSEEVLKFDSLASVHIESTQTTSSEENLVTKTCGVQKDKPTDMPKAKPSSKWEDAFYNWTKDYRKSGCDASQCSQCTNISITVDANEENTDGNEMYDTSICNDSVNEVSRTPKKQICSDVTDRKGASSEHENVRSKANKSRPSEACKYNENNAESTNVTSDTAVKTSDYCGGVSSFVELNSKMGRYIQVLNDKLQNKQDTSPSAVHDNQASSQNSIPQTGINVSLGFDTNDSPDLLTGTQPFDTENIKSQTPTESLATMPDILTGTQPFDKMSQTQGFVPELSNTQRSSSSSSNEYSFLSPSGTQKADEVKSLESASLVKSLTFTLKSGLSAESGSVSNNLSAAQADDLQAEEIRLQNLCKLTDRLYSDLHETGKSLDLKRKENNIPVRYRIFREKGRQNSSDDIQIESVDKRNKMEDNQGRLSSEKDRRTNNKDKNTDNNNVIDVSFDSQETIPDPNQERKETRTPHSDNLLEGNSSTSLGIHKHQNTVMNDKQVETNGSSVDINMSSKISLNVTANRFNEKTMTALAEWKPLDLSSISVQPVRAKTWEMVNENILRVKPIRRDSAKLLLPGSAVASSASPSVIEIDTESEFDFDVRKHKTVKTYEPKKAIIDGHEMGNKNMWMNIVKAPYPKPSKLKKKRKHNEEQSEKNPKRKEILVRKEVDGVFRFVRIPVQSSSNNSEDTTVNADSNVSSDVVTLGIDGSHAVVESSKCTYESVSTKDIDRGSDLDVEVNSSDINDNEFQSKISETDSPKTDSLRHVSDYSNKILDNKRNPAAESDKAEKENSSSKNVTTRSKNECQKQVRESNSEAEFGKIVSNNAGDKQKDKENSDSRIKKSSKRKHEIDENKSANCKIVKTELPVKQDHKVTVKSDLISTNDQTRRQTTIDSFSKDSEKEERMKKYLEGSDLRSQRRSFTQEWVAKQTFELHPLLSEESQKNDSLPTGNQY